jgi:glycosyltransferase involved in cell wall biosynthesis
MGVFNGSRYLARAISSILDQTFRDFEFVIIDDASTDETPEIVAASAARDPRIRVMTNRANAGLGKVLHDGVQAARGALVARMDADDAAMPERLEKQVRFMIAHPEVDVLGTFALDIGEDECMLGERKVPTTHDKIADLMWSNPLIHPTVMFRRDRILSVGSYSPTARRRQDYELWFRCLGAGFRFANLAEPLLRYQVTKESMRRNDVRAMWQQVKVGLDGCRSTGAPAHAYVAVTLPLVAALLPGWLRLRLMSLKKRVDPRQR